MPQVNVTIAGRSYRMACGEGEEAHLQAVAARLDDKISELKGHFGEIGDQRITVMAALTMADDLVEAERRIAVLETQVAVLAEREQTQDQRIDAMGEAVASAMDDMAARIDLVTRDVLAGARA
jgi:cell division protein ZapA